MGIHHVFLSGLLTVKIEKKVNIFQSLLLFSPEIGMLEELKTKFENQNEK